MRARTQCGLSSDVKIVELDVVNLEILSPWADDPLRRLAVGDLICIV
jgi:hypothetical protein